MAIIPGGIPHREVVLERDEPFENLVISVYNETVSVQLQADAGDGKAARRGDRVLRHGEVPAARAVPGGNRRAQPQRRAGAARSASRGCC